MSRKLTPPPPSRDTVLCAPPLLLQIQMHLHTTNGWAAHYRDIKNHNIGAALGDVAYAAPETGAGDTYLLFFSQLQANALVTLVGTMLQHLGGGGAGGGYLR